MRTVKMRECKNCNKLNTEIEIAENAAETFKTVKTVSRCDFRNSAFYSFSYEMHNGKMANAKCWCPAETG